MPDNQFKSIIIKVDSLAEQSVVNGQIRKYLGYINAKGVLDLLTISTLGSNPRRPKINTATEAIRETLSVTPELLCCKSKGLLVSCRNVTSLERGRLSLKFEEAYYKFEDVLDGGHNLFATSTFIIEQILAEDKPLLREAKKIKEWQNLKAFWSDHAAELLSKMEKMEKSAFNFLMPIEILTLGEDTDECDVAFRNVISDISEARNNNMQVSDIAHDNQKGIFDVIKQYLPSHLVDIVQWTTGMSEKVVKSEYVLVLVSFIFTRLKAETNLTLLEDFSSTPTGFYSGRGKCATHVQRVLRNLYTLEERDPTNPEIKILKNSLNLLKDMPRLWDRIERDFPELYRMFGGADGKGCYGRLTPFAKKTSKGKNATLAKDKPCRFHTPGVIQKKGEYETQDGYVAPLHYTIMRFMVFNEEKQSLEWRYDFNEIVDFYTPSDTNILIKPLMKQLGSLIVTAVHGDPQALGKGDFVYCAMDTAMEAIVWRTSLRQK